MEKQWIVRDSLRWLFRHLETIHDSKYFMGPNPFGFRSFENTADELLCLRPRHWLVGSVVNCYLHMINRHYGDGTVWCFHSWYLKLRGTENQTRMKSSFERSLPLILAVMPNHDLQNLLTLVRTKKLQKLLIPAHHVNHWFLCVFDFTNREYQVWNSMKNDPSPDSEFMTQIRKDMPVLLAHLHRLAGMDTPLHWTFILDPEVPQQGNYYDCGVFMCQTARAFAAGGDPHLSKVTQSGMPNFRKRMLVELCRNRLQKP